MVHEPLLKRAIVFIDGQNLFHAVKEAFGYTYPNYDVPCLARQICSAKGWQLKEIRFYTGIPDVSDNPFWNYFWTAKLASMGRRSVKVFSRPLRYRNQTIRLENGSVRSILVGQEKGIDVRIALDIVRSIRLNQCDVAVVFSQDQDLSEVAEDVRIIAHEQKRWAKIASVYPNSPTAKNRRGINKTDWIPLDRSTYDMCIDRRDYRPRTG